MSILSDVVALTRALVSFSTINPPGNERDCAAYVAGLLEDAGFRTTAYEFADRRTTLVARMAGDSAQKSICLTGHFDTVPLGTAAWHWGPFAGEIAGDRIYGRGTSDMKAGVAAMLLAARQVAKASGGRANILMVLTAGEETCCEGAYHLAKQLVSLENVGALLVGEPTSNYPLIGHKGALRFRIRTTGVTAHASTPHLGVNAIYKAADAIQKLRDLDFQVSPHPVLGAPTLNVGNIVGGQNINSVPDEAIIGVDIRTIPAQDHASVYELLRAALGPDPEISVIDQAQSVASDSTHPWIQEVFAIAAPVLGTSPAAKAAAFFTDASVLTPALGEPPTVILGPGEAGMAHKTDEYCHVSKIEAAVEVYTTILGRWCRV